MSMVVSWEISHRQETMFSLSFFKIIITILHLQFCHKYKTHTGFLEKNYFPLSCPPVPFFSVCLHAMCAFTNLFSLALDPKASPTLMLYFTFVASPLYLYSTSKICLQIFPCCHKSWFFSSSKICTRRLYEFP